MGERMLEIDSQLKCPTCGCVPYRIWRRQLPENPICYEHIIWPVEDGPRQPPENPGRIGCPDCGEELRRVAP